MPYVDRTTKARIDKMLESVDVRSLNEGSLNYAITKLVGDWLDAWGDNLGYAQLNSALGVLECAKQELYRRIVAPYESGKWFDNGDAYPQALVRRVHGQ